MGQNVSAPARTVNAAMHRMLLLENPRRNAELTAGRHDAPAQLSDVATY
jgi:hypothetical protein